MPRIVQTWIDDLGLRHQGVLLTAVRGCDTVPKEHVSKSLARAYRAEILVPHCGDIKKSASFMEYLEEEELIELMRAFCADLDQYPLHYVMHLAHAAEVIGYHHPQMDTASVWLYLYKLTCKKLHVTPETKEELDRRLNKDEESFGASQHDNSTLGG